MNIGDHIRAFRGGRWVHGIDCGDRTVICFSTVGHDDGKIGVQRMQLSEFSGGTGQVQVVTHTERVFPPKMVVARAFSRLRESVFSQMFSDSEQFAAWCKSGWLPPLGGGAEETAPRARGSAAAPPRTSRAAKKAVRTKAPARAQAAHPRRAKTKRKAPLRADAKSAVKGRPTRRTKRPAPAKAPKPSKASKRPGRARARARRRA